MITQGEKVSNFRNGHITVDHQIQIAKHFGTAVPMINKIQLCLDTKCNVALS